MAYARVRGAVGKLSVDDEEAKVTRNFALGFVAGGIINGALNELPQPTCAATLARRESLGTVNIHLLDEDL